MSDVVEQYTGLVQRSQANPDFVYDTVIIGGGAAGAGVLRDLASRGNVSAILVDRGPFGGETSSKTGKAIHPGIRYLRMAFHRFLLALHVRRDPKIRQTLRQNLHGAWLDLKLVWYGTRERKILLETGGGTVEEISNIVFVLPGSPEKKWAVFFGISLYDLFTTVWAWCSLVPRFSRVKLFFSNRSLHRQLPNLDAPTVLGGIRYWDGKANNDKILVVKAIRDAYYRGSTSYPIQAMSHVELDQYEWRPEGAGGHFAVRLIRRFAHEELPESVTIKAHTMVNAAGPWIDQVRNRAAEPDGRTTMAYSRGTHLEATNRFIHERLSSDPRVQVGLVPLDAERQHYLRPFHQHGLWYIQCTTTDRVHRDPDLIVPMPDEVDELLRSYNNLVSSAWKIDRRDIFNVFCGIRPLAATDGGEVAITDISRMFRINQRVGGGGVVLDLVNVKLTEFRWAGRVVGDLIAKQLRTQLARKVGRSRTHRVSLLPVVGEERFAPNRTGDRRCDREFISQKVAHYVTYQMASSLPDYLLNSGGIRDAVVFDRTGRCDLDLDLLDLMLAEMATCLHWDDQRRRGEWAAFTAIYTRMMAPAELGQRVRNHDPTASQRVPYAGVGGFD